jgi:hypothetical protein
MLRSRLARWMGVRCSSFHQDLRSRIGPLGLRMVEKH